MNKSNKGKPQPSGPPPAPETPPVDPFSPGEDAGNLSTLQLVDLIAHKMALQGSVPPDVTMLRRRVEEMEELQDQARNAVEKLSEAVDKLRAPALRLGTLLQKLPKDRALVCVNGTDYVCNLDPAIPEAARA